MKMNIYRYTFLWQIINSIFFFRNLCFETFLRFLNDEVSCNFDLITAQDILKDGRLLIIIILLLFMFKFARFEIVPNECKSQIQSISLNEHFISLKCIENLNLQCKWSHRNIKFSKHYQKNISLSETGFLHDTFVTIIKRGKNKKKYLKLCFIIQRFFSCTHLLFLLLLDKAWTIWKTRYYC